MTEDSTGAFIKELRNLEHKNNKLKFDIAQKQKMQKIIDGEIPSGSFRRGPESYSPGVDETDSETGDNVPEMEAEAR